LRTYEQIAAAWQKMQEKYLADLERLDVLQVQTGILGQASDAANRQMEQIELKRACITILDNKPVHGYDAVKEAPGTLADPKLESPSFAADGGWVRWFEQAFDWWLPRLQLKYGADPLFENFLKAGYARVVIPVRNGFRKAVNFYLATGRPWMGGDLPHVGDLTYLPITEEIKEQTGAPGDEKAVDEPWEYRLPTQLIKLRQDDKLPPDWKWVGHDGEYDAKGNYKDPAGTWNWKGDTGG
jgi:hypothetical protein